MRTTSLDGSLPDSRVSTLMFQPQSEPDRASRGAAIELSLGREPQGSGEKNEKAPEGRQILISANAAAISEENLSPPSGACLIANPQVPGAHAHTR